MKIWKKALALCLTLMMLASMATMLAGCGKDEENEGPDLSGETVTYEVKLSTQGGMAMGDVDVYLYSDKELSELQDFGKTDEKGTVSFDLPQYDGYYIALSNVPKGYEVAASYGFTGNTALITLNSRLVEGESLSGATLGLGDVMYDFTVTTPDGKAITLSQVLEEKDMVMLNFWYTTCTYCVAEFPYMEDAYQTYQEDIEIIALNPLNDSNAVKIFQEDQKLSFPMVSCQASWAAAFGITGYPTSIIVDRYGVICMVEAGGITSQRPFTCAFEHFTDDDYRQKLCENGISDLITAIKPTYTMEDSDTIGAAINKGDIQVTYRPETEDDNAEYSWPFILTEKNGSACLKASNQTIDDSFAILYADIHLEEGQAIGFDYLVSSESLCDILYVIVNDEDIYQISGVSENESWTSCYPCVALEAGDYELALCYLKDESTNEGDDTAYIRNVRVVDADEIDTVTYIPREAAVAGEGTEYEYVSVYYNSTDGYYHVGSKTGPLLLANLMGASQFNEEKSIFELTYDGDILVEGKSIHEDIVEYYTYASNSSLNGFCTVNKALAELLQEVASQAGFDGTDSEWLKICKYYQVYGTQTQLTDPIKGLAPFSAYTAKLGRNVATNCFYYDRAIIPRGLMAAFTPTKSGVYRITSENSAQEGVEAWIFDQNMETVYTYEADERLFHEEGECSMVYYMKAGTTYYIDIAFWDLYETGYIYYDVEYLGASYSLFRSASPGYFTYDTDATGDAVYAIIAGGIDVVLGTDGYYYEDLGKNSGGKQLYGSKIYADFSGISSLFDTPIATVYAYDDNGKIITDSSGNKVQVVGMIDKGAFDFSKTEGDLEILAYLKQNDNDVAATKAYLKTLWGDDYDSYADAYEIDDVFENRFHGEGEDLTAEMEAYTKKMITGSLSSATTGCVAVDARLAELLQMLMDKYTFQGVENAWLKVCYYYDKLDGSN